MAEASGDGWATHMFYGTARVLQLAGPARVSLQQRRGLFGAFRVLEATRVIMYGEETFLAGEAWRGVTGVDDAEADCAANPMAEVLDLMIRASSFSKRYVQSQLNQSPRLTSIASLSKSKASRPANDPAAQSLTTLRARASRSSAPSTHGRQRPRRKTRLLT